MNVDELPQHLEKVGVRLHQIPGEQPMQAVYRRIVQGIRDNFTSSVSPDGLQWPPRKHKGDGHPLLIDTGAMLQAATGGGAGHFKEIADTHVKVGIRGNRVKYAEFHETGTRYMPRRPYMGAQETVLEQIENAIATDGLKAFDV